MQLLNTVLRNKTEPLGLQIAKDDVVAFDMHDGRVYHDNLTFRLAAMQVELLVHSHGSVGLDETLDWFVELEFPGLQNADLSDRPIMKLLSQKPTLHIVGTLSQPQWKPDGLASQAVQAGIGLLKQRLEHAGRHASRKRRPRKTRQLRILLSRRLSLSVQEIYRSHRPRLQF